MGPPVREGYNKKGRQSSGGKRKKGKVKKRKTEDKVDEDGALSAQVADGGGHVQHDPNAEILVPKSKEEKELERKAKMLKEVRGLRNSRWHRWLIGMNSCKHRPTRSGHRKKRRGWKSTLFVTICVFALLHLLTLFRLITGEEVEEGGASGYLRETGVRTHSLSPSI